MTGRLEQAVILAAGEGQRLRPLTRLRPKVMLKVAGKPILQYVIEALAASGIREIVIVVGYHREQIQNYFGTGGKLGVNISYVTQEQQLGTAHALLQARDIVADRFMVVPGDNLIEAETLAPLLSVTGDALLIKTEDDVSQYAVVVVQGGKVSQILEKPQFRMSPWVSTGIFVLGRQVFDFMLTELDLPCVLAEMVAHGCVISAVETTGIWLDVVYPWNILPVNDFILGRISPSFAGCREGASVIRDRVSIGQGTVVRPGCYIHGPVSIGECCEIGPQVCILPSTCVGNNSVIHPFTWVKNSLIADNVVIGPHSSLEDSIVSAGVVIGGHFSAQTGGATVAVNGGFRQVKMGVVVGDNCHVEGNVVAQPGTIIGINSNIRSLKAIGGSLPDGSLVV